MIYLTKIVLGATILLTLFLILFLVRARTNKTETYLLLGQISSMLGWTCAIFLNIWHESIVIERYIFGFAALMLTFQFLFVSHFLRKHHTYTILDIVIVLTGTFFTVISFIPQTLFSKVEITDKGYTVLDTGPYSGFYALFVLISILASIIILALKRRREQVSILKTQLHYLLWGFSVFFIINLLTNSLLPVFFNIYFFNAIGPVFSLGLMGFIVYIIIHHQFLDLRSVIQRGVIYTTIFTSIALTYIALLSVSTRGIGIHTETAAIVSCFITATIGIFTVPRFDQFLRKKTDTIFFKDTYEYDVALETLSVILNRTLDQTKLIEEVTSALQTILKADSVSILSVDSLKAKQVPLSKSDIVTLTKKSKNKVIYTESLLETNHTVENVKKLFQFLKEKKSTLVIPVYTQSVLQALMLLGAKRSGEPYTRKDVNLLQTFALQAAVAFEKSALYKQVVLHSEELEQKIQERTQALETLQENQKRSMLTISHGLQTPLTVISGELYLLRNKLPEGEMRAIDHSIKDVSRYIYNLLRLARLEATADDTYLSNETTNISEIVLEVCETLLPLVRDGKSKIETTIEPNIMVDVPYDDVREIVSNILSNALKYRDASRTNIVTVSLTTTSTQAVFSVSDTGIGIGTESIPHIFDGYYRESRQTEKDGTGLGLAIVERITKKHHGSISVMSKKDAGTTFIVSLPHA